jgi:hypothetical protein
MMIEVLWVAFALLTAAPVQEAPPAMQVTRENFTRAETDNYFRNLGTKAFGRLNHTRELTPIDTQTVVRSNRDTLYSMGVFDLDAGPVTVVLPDAGGRFVSLQVVNEDHYISVPTSYAPGTQTYTREAVGTRYMALLMRTFIDPGDPADLNAAHAVQDAVAVSQAAPGVLELPAWDQASLSAVRTELSTGDVTDFSRAFGPRDRVDPEQHLIGTARGWGGNAPEDARYTGETPARNDGETVHELKVRDVPVDGFWSVTVYGEDGFMKPNPQNAYSLNNVTAKPEADGSYRIQFGGCDGGAANCLPITPGWNYTVRMYRPRAAILDDSWTFPKATPVE